MKKGVIIALVLAVVLIAILVVLLAKGYYDSRYVLDKYYYTVVPLDYDITPSVDSGGRFTDYALTCYNGDGEAKDLTFSVLIDAHSSDLYPPGTFLRVSCSKLLVIGRRAIDRSDVPERALARIDAVFAPTSALSLAEYAAERTGQLAPGSVGAHEASCAPEGSALRYIYVFSAGGKAAAEAAAELLDPVYKVQFRTDKDAFPELTAIFLEIRMDDGTVVFSQKYDTRVKFDYEN